MEVGMKRHLIKRAWWRWRGEQHLLTTFWPRDYSRKSTQALNGIRYVITRYARSSADPRFFEVWGQPQERAVPLHRDTPQASASDLTFI